MYLSKDTPELSVYLPHQESIFVVPADFYDLPMLYEWLNNEAVYQYLSGRPASDWIALDHLMSLERAPRLREWKLHEWSIRTEDNTHVGYMQVTISEKKPEAHWGLSVVGPDNLRGRGLGSIAKGLILEELFLRRGIERVKTGIREGNEASTRFNMKYGAKKVKEGDISKYVFSKESWLRACENLKK